MLTAWPLREEESLSITNINLLIRFNETRKIFPSATRISNILLTTTAITPSAEKANSKDRVD